MITGIKHDAPWLDRNDIFYLITNWFFFSRSLSFSVLGLNVKMSHSNKNKKKGADPMESDKIKLARLMPLDMWFYNYSSQVHDAKWKLYQITKSSKVSQADLDRTLNGLADDMITNLPKHISGCRSTRFILSCPEEKFYFQMNMSDACINSQQRALLLKTFS